ncbi:MAG: polysaccharide biosynthesis tyrosine autokinase [Acidobacteriales bacterium]|nr:polysaccharide biosynthesis tyrosine autokinase [Terriglobales bacterium]
MNDLTVARSLSTNQAVSPWRQQRRENEVQNETLDVRSLVESLLHKKLQILAIMLLVLIPVLIGSYLATPFYRASAVIQINPEPVQVLPYRDVADNGSGGYFEAYMATQDQLLRSPSLRDRVAKRLQAEPAGSALVAEAAHLGERLEVKRIPTSQLYSLSYLAPKPETATRIVNLFTEEYVKQHFESRQETRERARDSLRKELKILEMGVQAAEKQLVSYAQRENIVKPEPGQSGLVQKRLMILDNEIAQAETELIQSKTKLEALQRASTRSFPDRLVTPAITSLINRVLQLENELVSLRTTYGEQWPAVKAKRTELNMARAQLDGEQTATLNRAVEQAQVDFQTIQRRLAMLKEAITRQKGLVDRLDSAYIQYNILRREAEVNQKLYEGLLERLKQTGVSGGVEFGNIQVLEPGRADPNVASPRIWQNVGLASMLGLALGACVTLLVGFWDRSISNLAEAERLVGLPGLGSVPLCKSLASGGSSRGMLWLKNKPARAMVRAGSSGISSPRLAAKPGDFGPPLRPEMAEAIRGICTSLLLSQSDRELRVIVITSATPAEGKSTIANHMARALADAGARTLLVEADMRNPMLSRAFASNVEAGLSLFLSGHMPHLPTAQETDNDNLFFISGGPQPPNPVALFNSERMRVFLKDMSSEAGYRFIVLDTPPVLAVSDARVLAARADGVVLVVRARHTTNNLVVRARNLLESAGANILGIVLNGTGGEDPESTYYHRYYHKA